MASKELKKQVQKEVDAELNKSENLLVEIKDSNEKWAIAKEENYD